MAFRELLDLPGIHATSPAFRAELIRMSDRLRLNPQFIEGVMSFESRINPQAVNKESGATGLIQFMPETARRFGTSVEALVMMTAEEQLVYVERFYKPFAGRLKDPGDYYMATFLPAHVGAPDDRILSVLGEPVYQANKGLDRDKNGELTAGDVYQAIESLVEPALQKPRILVDMSFVPTTINAGVGLVVSAGIAYLIERYL